MPKYIMKDPDSVEHEVWCSIAEMQAKKVLGWTMVFQPNKNKLSKNIVTDPTNFKPIPYENTHKPLFLIVICSKKIN